MEVRKESDVTLNRNTLQGMIKPIADFINEHKADRDKMSLLNTAINELLGELEITPTMSYGALMSSMLDMERNVRQHAMMRAVLNKGDMPLKRGDLDE